MNWFERYGIPGTYFYIALLAGLYALYPHKMVNVDMRALAAFAVSFLPVGYIITVFTQWLYLSSKKYGLHTKAADEWHVKSIDGKELKSLTEADIEALSSIHITNCDKDEIDAHKFIREWIRKRMDVLTINYSMQIATILDFLLIPTLGFALWRYEWQRNSVMIGLLLAVFVFILFFTMLSSWTVERQVIKAIQGAWEASGFKAKCSIDPQATPNPTEAGPNVPKPAAQKSETPENK